MELFFTFSKIGLFTFGGGYSMLPLLQREVVEKKHWATMEQMTDYITLGQCMPGTISVNVAALVGCSMRGSVGGTVATLGVISPSVIIILLVSVFMKAISTIEIISHIFSGIRISVSALILSSALSLAASGIQSKFGLFIFTSAILLTVLTDISPITIIVIAVVLSIIYVRKGFGSK